MQEIRCPSCRRPTTREGNPHRPFCSERCRLHDLGNWASERYRIPAPPDEPFENLPENDDDGDQGV
jgi:endogenous inhibitor of DNA gyrase (YacG/DUF329 family)